jgi:hypothetical protein
VPLVCRSSAEPRSATRTASERSPITSLGPVGAGDDVVVVVSAMGKTTDDLIRLAERRQPVRPGRELDMLAHVGERISMALVHGAGRPRRRRRLSFTGSQAGIITDTSHTKARILEIRPERLRERSHRGVVPVVAGFQGRLERPRRHDARAGRLGHDRGRASPLRARRGPLRDLHRCLGSVHRRPPCGAERARLTSDLFRRDARDRRDGRHGARAALGRVRPEPSRTAPRPFEFHLGARDLGH